MSTLKIMVYRPAKRKNTTFWLRELREIKKGIQNQYLVSIFFF